jgi:hypothetical protein
VWAACSYEAAWACRQEALREPDVRFEVVSNPEFLSEGQAIANLLEPSRVLIGSLRTPEGLKAATVRSDITSRLLRFISPRSLLKNLRKLRIFIAVGCRKRRSLPRISG